jgi:hypothetical protein
MDPLLKLGQIIDKFQVIRIQTFCRIWIRILGILCNPETDPDQDFYAEQKFFDRKPLYFFLNSYKNYLGSRKLRQRTLHEFS